MCNCAMCDGMIYKGVMTERAGKRWKDRERAHEREWMSVNETEREKVNSIAACLCSGLGVFLKKEEKEITSSKFTHRESVFRMPDKPKRFSMAKPGTQRTYNREFSVSASYSDEFTNFFFRAQKLLLQFTVWCVLMLLSSLSFLCLCNCEKAPRYQSTCVCVCMCERLVRLSNLIVAAALLSYF